MVLGSVTHTTAVPTTQRQKNSMAMMNTRLLSLDLSSVNGLPDHLQAIAKDQDCVGASILDCCRVPHMRSWDEMRAGIMRNLVKEFWMYRKQNLIQNWTHGESVYGSSHLCRIMQPHCNLSSQTQMCALTLYHIWHHTLNPKERCMLRFKIIMLWPTVISPYVQSFMQKHKF